MRVSVFHITQSNITMYDVHLEVFSGSRFYRVYTPHTLFIRDLITLMNLCYKEQHPEDSDNED